jgi:hypothetical protein
MDPYRILGLQPNADTGQIRAAYRQRARAAHPDAGGTDTAFSRLQDAYQAALSARSTSRQAQHRRPVVDEDWDAVAQLRRQFRAWRQVRAWQRRLRQPVLVMLVIQVLLLSVVAVSQPGSPVPIVLASLGTGVVVGALRAVIVAHRASRP